MVKFLLKRGADINVINNHFETPLDQSLNFDRQGVAAIIRENDGRRFRDLQLQAKEKLKYLIKRITHRLSR